MSNCRVLRPSEMQRVEPQRNTVQVPRVCQHEVITETRVKQVQKPESNSQSEVLEKTTSPSY